MRTSRRLAVGCLLLFFMCGSMMAQNDTPFVIKKGDNYLAHVKIEEEYVLQSASTFNPSTCLWYSGPTYNPTGYTHNYYFEDDAHNLRFLAAPLEPNGELSLSASLPSVSLLRNTDQVYYFYNWDPETHLNGVPEGGGVARGKRYYVNTAEECHACGTPPGATWYETNTTNHTYQCWEVYWIEYSGSEWKLSNTSSYNITTNAARYRKVTVTEHEKEITAGGLTTLTVPSEMNFQENPLSSAVLSALVGSPYSYIPAYANYVFLENGSESVHNYWGNTDHGGTPPGAIENVAIGSKNYQWTISGDGVEYLSFNSGSDVNTSTDELPTLYYRVPNNTGHKMATITVTVTYTAQNEQTTQTRSATVLVKTPCGNPSQAAAPVVTYTGVTVSWAATAAKYKVDWKKHADENYGTPVEVIGASSYTIIGLDYQTQYDYRVTAYCGENYETPPTSPTGTFTTKAEPGLLVNGAIFGGGRMANVGGKTEVVIVNCDSIGAIYGGNDIAGEVEGGDGSIIKLGVNSGDAYASYGTTPNNGKIRVSSVYGGGNGYYTYDGYEPGIEIGTTVLTDRQFHSSVTEVGGGESYATSGVIPTISKTAIMVTNDKVKVDSIFGGAKNAFLTYNGTNAEPDGSLITINGGTIMAVFGGNNFGGKQGYGLHHIVVNGTTTCLTNSNGQPQAGTLGHQFGHDFGIGYLFGGGNKVYGSTTNIEIFGGQTDNVFGGGNSADVYAANVSVDCSLGAYSSEHPYTYGNTYTNAIPTSYASGAISIKEDYPWDGKGIYNVRNLYGGNNMEHMATVPTVTLSSGSVGTVYGGGNAGDMLASSAGSIDEDGDNTPDISFNYSTNVVLNSANIIVDYLYGGCRMSNVDYSTWVQIQDGHVGTVFGGCNVSGDVGSTRVNPSAASGTAAYQEVQGGTYVEASGGTVYKNLFAGGNGFYHCNQNFHYVSGVNYTDENFVDKLVPSHNETYANVRTGATIKGNVYAGGNLAPVGFQDQVAPYFPSFPTDAVGWAVVHIYGGTIEGNVFGGGNMADVYGSNDVMVAGGTIAAVYGGNDRTGQVGEFSNRVLPTDYSYATDGSTILITPNDVRAYVRIVGNPTIQEVYGGGNGDYDYEHGDEVVHQYCDENESGPIQSNTFVDIHIDGGENGGHIGTVYGGGDGVTASGFITVFMNIVEPNPAEDYVNVNTVFGGNNKGDLDIVPNIILLHGQVGTVYGGCNEGAMTAATGVTVGDYANIGSYVRLLSQYKPNGTGTPVPVTAKVTEAVYGGCRMNGVTRNSLVLVEGGDFSGMTKGLFGGSDISGDVSGISYVVINGSYNSETSTYNGIVNEAYGGGNGNYTYDSGPYSGLTPPFSRDSRVIMLDGKAANLYAGGYAGQCGVTTMTFDGGLVTGSVFGGGNMAGSATSYNLTTTTFDDQHVSHTTTSSITTTGNSSVTVNGGSIYTGVYGGCNSSGTIAGDIIVDVLGGIIGASGAGNEANIHGGGYGAATQTSGDVTVNIGATSGGETPTYSGTAVIYGDVYGGSALGQVSASNNLTQVNFYKGTINGDVYGGGLGNNEIPAVVSGAVEVNIRGGVFNAADGTLGGGRIFGGNNANGTPKGNVNVNIYATYHGTTPQTNMYPTAPEGGWTIAALDENTALPQAYAISAVYGGGNKAAYKPVANKSTTVHIYNCNNTVKDVYGGGNAADVGTTGEGAVAANTFVIVDGGRINRVFGGGNGAGSGNPGANIYGTATTTVKAGLIDQVFGGGNEKGSITATSLTVNHASSGCEEVISEIFGGGNLAPIASSGGISTLVECGTDLVGDIYGGSNKANITGNVTLNIKGGEYVNVFGGSKGVAGTAADIDGNVTLNLMGGKITNAFGGSNINGNITGNITVNVIDYELTDCGLDLTNVYGGGKDTPYNPDSDNHSVVNVIHIKQDDGIGGNVFGGAKGSTATVTANPVVNIGYNATTMSSYVTGLTVPNSPRAYVKGNVFGGGDAAPVDGSTKVNVFNGEIVHKLVGGGNEAGVSMNSEINVYGGSLCTTTEDNKGIYGGCNNNGTVGENTFVTLTGGTIGAYGAGNGANVHGGGFGQPTSVAGNVTVTFGDINAAQGEFPKLYGNLYGGSALGNVNDNASDITTVNVYNGTITGTLLNQPNPADNVYGNVFGGGLGDVGVEAKVFGEVHVNIGKMTAAEPPATEPTYIGKATLANCNVFGCNNMNGSPQTDVYVDVYGTYRSATDDADYFDSDNTYAIYQVFGGGNKAHYAPEGNDPNSDRKTHVTVHGCENSVKYVYGGSNAANAVGVVTIIEGGRFNEIYGGGNGRETAANIGTGGIGLNVLAGNVGFLFKGSNKNGINYGLTYEPYATTNCLGGLFVDSYFFGTNEAEYYGDLDNTITCAEAGNYEYRYVFAGSRWGIVYGDIKLIVYGGTIENLFGGCRGYEDYSADVRRFPTWDEIAADQELPENKRKYSQDLLDYMGYNNGLGTEPSYVGHGGNITLIVSGGTIGKVYGGCDIKGNVEGKISVTVNDAEDAGCPLFVGDVYGASNRWYHVPVTSDLSSPEVQILKGTIGGTHTDLPVNNISGNIPTEYAGNVFGGGNYGYVTADPIVIIGDGPSAKVTIKGDVYGGGNEGDINGNARVTVVPKMHTLHVAAVDLPNRIRVINSIGQDVTTDATSESGVAVGEGMSLNLIAMPSVTGQTFTGWSSNGHLLTNALSFFFTMGTEDCSITASFAAAPTKTFSYSLDPADSGTIQVTDGNGAVVNSGVGISQGAVLYISASPYVTHKFMEWQVTEGNGTVANRNTATTTFTMGSEATTIKAMFDGLTTHNLTLTTPSHGSFIVKDNHNNIIGTNTPIGEGTVLNMTATPTGSYVFGRWTVEGEGASVANQYHAATTFVMGTDDAILGVNFVQPHTFNFTQHPNGTIKVMDSQGQTVNSGASVGEGAVLNIKAVPKPGYAFVNWVNSGGTGTIANDILAVTAFTMGASEATITANFITAHILTVVDPELIPNSDPEKPQGTIKVTNIQHQSVSSPASIGENAVLTIVATPTEGYQFAGWERVEGNGVIGDLDEASTTFTMKTQNTTIKANFEPISEP